MAAPPLAGGRAADR